MSSTNPATGVAIVVTPADTNNAANGSTGFTRVYDSGASVTLTAPATAGANTFSKWTGCTTTTGATCSVTLNSDTTVTAAYTTPTPPATYTLTVNSTNPASGVAIAASPADNNSKATGNTAFTLTYNAGTLVTLTAPDTASGKTFSSWTGCSITSAETCNVTLGANATVTANYAVVTSGVTGVTVGPTPAALAPGATQQFTATVSGTGTFTTGVNWSVNGVSGGDASSGTVSATGLYVTPFPVPSGAITVTATSTFDLTKSGSAVVNLTVPTTSGPTLAIDAAAGQHPISPLIYGMNAFNGTGVEAMADDVRLPVNRYGGDGATRYNYKIDTYDSASDYYFEAYPSSEADPEGNSDFNQEVERNVRTSTKTLGTMPLIGWTTKTPPAGGLLCGFSVAKYGAQQKTDQYHPDCGNGIKPDGYTKITGNDPTDTSFTIDQTWTTGWVQYLVGKFGDAAHGGVAIYDLDNEPEYWFGVHFDVHPVPLSYDELTTKGLAYAKAIKDADPTAEVSGFVVSSWNGYFYSPTDWISGWSTGPNYVYNGNPVDRIAHGNVPLVEYYLQQFKKYDDTNSVRLLDYLDIHGYYAAPNAAFNTAGATDLQAARLNSTRAFWDPTYTDPDNTDPTDTSNHPKPGTPMLIPRLKAWVAADYPGTKVAIDEYNWGAQEHINGAVTQVDILGIFGREGLDLGALWGAPDATTQMPSVNAFKVFRNYDNAGTAFGETSVSATSSDQSKIAVYAATRAVDNTLTIVVVNKSFSNLTDSIALSNVTAAGPAKVFLYSNANLAAIVPQTAVTVTANALSSTFPAQSITIFALPLK